MKNEELYNRTINILAKAFRDGTLRHGYPCACAVGNLINYYAGTRGNFEWFRFAKFSEPSIHGEKQVKLTGYSVKEIVKIEAAFEDANTEFFPDSDGFLGLMAVVDALDIIHENTSTDITVKAKKQIEDKVVLELV